MLFRSRRQEEEARRIKAEREAIEEQLREREDEAAAIRAFEAADEATLEPADEPADEPAEAAEPHVSADSTGDQWKISEFDIEPEEAKIAPEPVTVEVADEPPREITRELHRGKILAEIERQREE